MMDYLSIVLSLSALILVCFLFYCEKSKVDKNQKEIKQLQLKLLSSVKERQAERKGRIRAQQELREKTINSFSSSPSPSPSFSFSSTIFPFHPIGIIRSCFTKRNGTPRQPLLVPSARARLELTRGIVSPSTLEGLSSYSHCWIIYVFHKNTNIERLWKNNDSFKHVASKINVPRLNGKKLGVFATRSPHRPNPIGLSVAKIENVDKNFVFLSGVDIVDGSPVLDIKPYIPYSDSLKMVKCPDWVEERKVIDPLSIASIKISDDVYAMVEKHWDKKNSKSLYSNHFELMETVKEVLSRDIRSVNQRLHSYQANSLNLDHISSIKNDHDNNMNDNNHDDVNGNKYAGNGDKTRENDDDNNTIATINNEGSIYSNHGEVDHVVNADTVHNNDRNNVVHDDDDDDDDSNNRDKIDENNGSNDASNDKNNNNKNNKNSYCNDDDVENDECVHDAEEKMDKTCHDYSNHVILDGNKRDVIYVLTLENIDFEYKISNKGEVFVIYASTEIC